jgi:hypothetical protein
MKNKLILVVLALFVVSELVTAHGSLSGGMAQSAKGRFDTTKYGTLLELFNEKGESVYEIKREGFAVKYKTAGTAAKSAWAIENRTEGLRAVRKQHQGDDGSTTIVVRTQDKVLEITTTFMVKGDALFIARTFRNISSKTVTIQSVSDYVGSPLDKDALNRIKAGLNRDGEDCGAISSGDKSDCTTPTPCVGMCPPDPNSPFLRAQLVTEKGYHILQWLNSERLKPMPLKQGGDPLASKLTTITSIGIN